MFILDLLVMHGFLGSSASANVIRGIVSFGLLFYLLIPRFRINISTGLLLVFMFYVLFLLLYRGVVNGEMFIGVRWFSKVFISLLSFVVGYKLINSVESFNKLNRNTLILGYLLLTYIFMSNIFDFGVNMYVSEELDVDFAGFIKTGLFGGNSMNALSYVLLLAPIILHTSDSRRKYIIMNRLMFVGLFIVLVLVMRRSAILIVILGYAFYLLKAKEFNFRINITAVFIVVLLSASIYLFIDSLISIIEIRGSHVISGKAIESDTRTRELIYIFEKVYNSGNISFLLFGESFNTVNVFRLSTFGRSLHSDFSVLIYVTGHVGLIIYLFFNFSIILNAYKKRKRAPKIFFYTLFVLIFTSLVLMYSGRLTSILFRTIVFIYAGSILSILNSKSKVEIHAKNILTH